MWFRCYYPPPPICRIVFWSGLTGGSRCLRGGVNGLLWNYHLSPHGELRQSCGAAMVSPPHGGHTIHEGGILSVFMKLHCFVCVCWRRGHSSYIILRRLWTVSRDPAVRCLSAWSDKRCKICPVAVRPGRPTWPRPPSRRCARSCVVYTQQFSDQKCNFIFMCPLEVCCGEYLQE